jgi:hypothetical protein
MSETKKVDTTFYSTIIINGRIIRNVLCRLYLPTKITDSIELHFSPSAKQADIIRQLPFWKFSMKGKVTNHLRKIEKTIVANTVYASNFETKYHSHNLTEPYFVGEPVDMTITQHLNHSNSKSESKVDGRFWITPNDLLQPAFISLSSYTGEVKIEPARSFEFRVDRNLLLKFENYHKNYKNDYGDKVSFYELVAAFELEGKTNKSREIFKALEKLDDILLLASFAARKKCVCLGWDSADSKTFLRKYLRNRTIPKDINRKNNPNDCLIDLSKFTEFMETAYKNFQNYSDIDAFRRTMNFIQPSYDDTVEGSFVNLYSALEMIVLHFRRQKQLEFILPSRKFEKVRKEIKTVIENSTLIDNESEKNEIKKKLSELNRISFASAFDEFCNLYSVDLSDLWSVNSNNDGISLSQMRNKLVHGEHFSQKHYVGLFYASEHLRWTIERMVLAVLGWSFKNSNVSPSYLRMMNPHLNWRNELSNFK